MTALKTTFKRSELDRLEFSNCRSCAETICWSKEKATLKMVALDPKPVGGTEIDALYGRHFCKQEDE